MMLETADVRFLGVSDWQAIWKPIEAESVPVKGRLDNLEKVLNDLSGDGIGILKDSDYEDFTRLVSCIVNFGLVQDFVELEERDYDARDFPGLADLAEKCFRCLKQLFLRLNFQNFHSETHNHLLIPAIKLCATHNKPFVWSSEAASSSSQDVLEAMLKFSKHSDLKTLLCIESKDCHAIFKQILLDMRPSLSKENWTRNPSNCQVFKWLLFNVKHPYLVHYLPEVLPPSLMFTDHHVIQYKVIGIECLSHIIDNVPPTELKMYGRADVVYDVLFHLIYCKEIEVIQVLYPCILMLLIGQEKNLHSSREPRKWGRYDDVYHQLMWNMEMEEKILFRREYSTHLVGYIEQMGITIVKHMKRTLRVLENYLSIFDGPQEISRINALKALTVLIKIAWPRMEYHCETLLKIVLFLIYDIETERGTSVSKVKEEVLSLCKECLLLLKRACTEKFKNVTADLVKLEEKIPALDILRSVYHDTS